MGISHTMLCYLTKEGQTIGKGFNSHRFYSGLTCLEENSFGSNKDPSIIDQIKFIEDICVFDGVVKKWTTTLIEKICSLI